MKFHKQDSSYIGGQRSRAVAFPSLRPPQRSRETISKTHQTVTKVKVSARRKEERKQAPESRARELSAKWGGKKEEMSRERKIGEK